MATVTPTELLKAWKREEMPSDMAIGHVLQNLVILRADIDRLIRHIGLSRVDEGKRKLTKSDEPLDPEQPS